MAQEADKVALASASGNEPSAATAQPPSPASTEIRSQIEQTRLEITETIDAIQARLSPRRLVTDATQTVKDATVGGVKRLADGANHALGATRRRFVEENRAIDTMRTNPVPFALAGVAATALVAGAMWRSRNSRDRSAQRVGAARGESWRNRNRIGVNTQRFLLGACATVGCWSAWTARRSRPRLTPGAHSRISRAEATPFEPIAPDA